MCLFWSVFENILVLFQESEHDAPGEYIQPPQNYQLWVSICQICKQLLLFLRKESITSSSIQKSGVATAVFFDCGMSTKPLAHTLCSLQLGMRNEKMFSHVLCHSWSIQWLIWCYSLYLLNWFSISKNVQWLHIMQWKILLFISKYWLDEPYLKSL